MWPFATSSARSVASRWYSSASWRLRGATPRTCVNQRVDPARLVDLTSRLDIVLEVRPTPEILTSVMLLSCAVGLVGGSIPAICAARLFVRG